MSKSMSTRSRALLRAGLAAGAVTAIVVSTATVAFAANTTITLDWLRRPGRQAAAPRSPRRRDRRLPRQQHVPQGPHDDGGVSGHVRHDLGHQPRVRRDAVDQQHGQLHDAGEPGAGVYKVCIYGAATAVAAATPIVANAPTFTVTAAVPVVTPSAGPVTPGGTITATRRRQLPQHRHRHDRRDADDRHVCRHVHATAPNLVATATKDTDGAIATVTIPNGVVAGSNYKVCLYDGNTVATSALLRRVHHDVRRAAVGDHEPRSGTHRWHQHHHRHVGHGVPQWHHRAGCVLHPACSARRPTSTTLTPSRS